MTLHYFDIIAYVVGLILIYLVSPDDWKHELGILALLFVMIIYTIIFVIVFAFLDYNVVDLLGKTDLTLKIEK
jgi:hypothetical protein